jgi:hypothetical protein
MGPSLVARKGKIASNQLASQSNLKLSNLCRLCGYCLDDPTCDDWHLTGGAVPERLLSTHLFAETMSADRHSTASHLVTTFVFCAAYPAHLLRLRLDFQIGMDCWHWPCPAPPRQWARRNQLPRQMTHLLCICSPVALVNPPLRFGKIALAGKTSRLERQIGGTALHLGQLPFLPVRRPRSYLAGCLSA